MDSGSVSCGCTLHVGCCMFLSRPKLAIIWASSVLYTRINHCCLKHTLWVCSRCLFSSYMFFHQNYNPLYGGCATSPSCDGHAPLHCLRRTILRSLYTSRSLSKWFVYSWTGVKLQTKQFVAMAMVIMISLEKSQFMGL